MQRFDRRLHPGEQEASNGRKLRRQHRQEWQSAISDQPDVERTIELSWIGVGKAAQDGVPVHLRERDDHRNAKYKKNDCESPTDRPMCQEWVGADRSHTENET